MRGSPERIIKGRNENTYSKRAFKMRGRPERIFKGGAYKHL